jgi:quercetin dioxygenase-like cupin family protein
MTAAPGPDRFWFLDTLVTVHVSHDAGTDTISLLEHRAPQGHSPPLHVHHSEDELFHVLSGEFRFGVGGQEHRLAAGAFLLTPKGVPHTFRVESASGGQWLTVTTHTDFERFVRAVGRPAPRAELPPAAAPPTPEAAAHLAEVGARFGIELVGSPLD